MDYGGPSHRREDCRSSVHQREGSTPALESLIQGEDEAPRRAVLVLGEGGLALHGIAGYEEVLHLEHVPLQLKTGRHLRQHRIPNCFNHPL